MKHTLLVLIISSVTSSIQLLAQTPEGKIKEVDSIVASIDSVIYASNKLKPSSVRQWVVHFACTDSSSNDLGFGSGGHATLMMDGSPKKLLKLNHYGGCQTMAQHTVTYFANNKIILITYEKEYGTKSFYFDKDKWLVQSNHSSADGELATAQLEQMYAMVKDMVLER